MHPNRTLFENYVHLKKGNRLLVCNPSDARFVAMRALGVARTDVFPRDWATLGELRTLVNEWQHVNVHETIFPVEEGVFDVALIDIPKGRELARAWMVSALSALRPDGILFAAGPNNGGAKTALTDLKAITRASNLGNKARHRIFSALRPANLAIPENWSAPGDYQRRAYSILGESFEVFTHPGVFSYDHLDAGTALLLDQLPALKLPPGLRVLDAGCGVGIIGMAAARILGAREVVLADSDLLAIQCARRNMPDATTIAIDLTQESLPPFDLILCNPPFHQENDKSLAFMTAFASNARRMLAPGGDLVLVYNHFLPYRDSLQQHFASVQVVANDGRYTVVRASAA